MFSIESIIQLKEEENIEAIVRRHLASLIPSLFFAMIIIVLPFFFLFPLFSLGVIGVLIFGISIMIGILWAIRSLFLWNTDVLVVTNMRIVDVDQKGILSRKVSEAPYDVIQDVSWKREGIWQTIFRMGSVSIQTAGSSATIEAERVPQPGKLHEIINDERLRYTSEPKEHIQSPQKKDRRSRIRRIAELLEEVSDTSVAEIEAVLERKVKSSSMEKLFNEKPTNDVTSEEDQEELKEDER
ncbi:MAG: PH domain-containing protein [Patescibacteria group bacterium]|nr:PH domain-containing protein [Patescibacteria group bacterium]